MRVFVAGGTGVIGRRLVPQLVARGHQVTATTTSAGKLGLLEQLGAEGVVMDGLDAASVGEAVAAARPDAIVNQMTGLSVAHAGKPNLRKADRFFATTNRLRSEGIDHLLAAAEATGVSHVVAQGHASMNGDPQGRMGQDRGGPAGGDRGDEGDQPPRGRGRQGWRRGPALRRVLRAGRQRRSGQARAEAAVPARRGRHRLRLVGACRRRGERYRPGGGAEGEGRVQHRRRRAGTGQRVAALSRGVRRGQAAAAGPQRGWPGCWPARWRWA